MCYQNRFADSSTNTVVLAVKAAIETMSEYLLQPDDQTIPTICLSQLPHAMGTYASRYIAAKVITWKETRLSSTSAKAAPTRSLNCSLIIPAAVSRSALTDMIPMLAPRTAPIGNGCAVM